VTTPTKIPTWLQQHLEQLGQWNDDSVFRRARTVLCRTCGAPVARGLDGDVCALAAVADLTPLNQLGELTMILTGRATYDLCWRNSRYEIDRRDQWAIQARPPGRPNHVVAEHQCGNPIPTEHVTPYPQAPTTRAVVGSDKPPY
jgi:hypothetical protein